MVTGQSHLNNKRNPLLLHFASSIAVEGEDFLPTNNQLLVVRLVQMISFSDKSFLAGHEPRKRNHTQKYMKFNHPPQRVHC